MKRLIVTYAVLLALAANQAAAQPNAGSGQAQVREQAVQLGRDGAYDESLSVLARLRESLPRDQGLLEDEITILGWAERDADVLARLDALSADPHPHYVATTIAKSARNMRQFDLAVEWYGNAVALDAADLDSHLGLAMTLAESGDYRSGLGVLDALPDEQGELTAALLARGYVLRTGGQYVPSLHAYDRVLTGDASNSGALRGKALVLRDLLLPEQALQIASDHPGILTDEEIGRLEVDRLAIRLRLATRSYYPRENDRAQLDAAIADIERRLDAKLPGDPALALEYDRIVALGERRHIDEAVEAFDALGTPLAEAPAYVLAQLGKLYMEQRRPKLALQALQLAAEKNPGSIDTQLALVYANLDLDRFDEAMAIARRLAEQEPFLIRSPDSPIVKGNQRRINIEIISGVAEASMDLLDDAQLRFETLLAEAPNNTDLRHELANVYRWRGWIDRSMFEYRQVLTAEENLLHARIGYLHTQIDAQLFPEVDTRITELVAANPNNTLVDRLSERWETHNRSELVLTTSSGESTGSTFGVDQSNIDAFWYSQPIRNRFRALAHLHESTADFPDATRERQRAGAGVQYRHGRWSASGELTSDLDTDSTGLMSSFDWRLTDFWRVSGVLELDSTDMQLRGHSAGVEVDRTGLSARYSANESASYGVSYRHTEFTDNNAGDILFGDARRNVLRNDRWSLDVTGEVSTSQSRLQDVAYFSPQSDVSYLIGGRHRLRLFRRYDFGVNQTIDLQAGRYAQEGFSSGEIWSLNYTVDLQLGRRFALQLGARRARMFYDGIVEHGTTVSATFRARL